MQVGIQVRDHWDDVILYVRSHESVRAHAGRGYTTKDKVCSSGPGINGLWQC